MKIKAIVAICKKEKSIILFDDEQDENQWLGDGYAAYPLLKMPYMREHNIFALFDIPDIKQDGYLFKQREFPEGVNFNNKDSAENKLKEEKLLITTDGRTLKPFQTSKGLIFIDAKYIKPVSDEIVLNYYERFTKEGNVYIVVKNGMEVIAIIPPFSCIDEKFVNKMQALTDMCKIALQSSK